MEFFAIVLSNCTYKYSAESEYILYITYMYDAGGLGCYPEAFLWKLEKGVKKSRKKVCTSFLY